jgi:caa(3)-type oxidase subunit IV
MSETHSQTSYKSYWLVWGVLLVITGIMLIAELSPFSRLAVAVLLMVAMLVKASLIAGQFMHLRFEKPELVLAFAGTVLFLAAFLFVLISFDALRILKMVQT